MEAGNSDSWNLLLSDHSSFIDVGSIHLREELNSRSLTVAKLGRKNGPFECSSPLQRFGIALLAVHKTLKRLTLEGSLCTADLLVVFEAIRHNESITFLSVNCESVPDGDIIVRELAEAIKENKTLVDLELNLSGTKVGDVGGVAIASAIKQNRTITGLSLDLAGTKIEEATGVALAEALKDWQGWSFVLDARGTQLGDKSGMKFAEAVQQNQIRRCRCSN